MEYSYEREGARLTATKNERGSCGYQRENGEESEEGEEIERDEREGDRMQKWRCDWEKFQKKRGID